MAGQTLPAKSFSRADPKAVDSLPTAIHGYSSTDGIMVPLKVDSSGNLETTATISGDVNVDSTSVDTSGYIGKASGTNGDFTTAYASATTLTLSSLPSDVSAITADDIISIVQISTAGAVTNTYSRDDVTITASGTDPTTLTVTGAAFVTTDSFVIYTNIGKPSTIEAEGTPDSTANSKISQQGGIAESTIPTEVADGDAVAQWLDTFGRQVLKGFNLSADAQDTNQVNQAILNTQKVTGITQLTAPGATAEIIVDSNNTYGYIFTVAGITTNVIIKLEGSVDETNYATIPLENTAVANSAVANNRMTITADGTYIIYSNAPIYDVRLDFVSESGGTAATIDADYFARRS